MWKPILRSKLAAFYFYRGNTRSLLGRSLDEIADGKRALAAARAGGDATLYYRTDHPAATTTTRGLPLKRRNSPKLDGVESAELALLARLPDTTDEALNGATNSQLLQTRHAGRVPNEERARRRAYSFCMRAILGACEIIAALMIRSGVLNVEVRHWRLGRSNQ